MNEHKPKKAWYKKWWVWVIIIFVLIGIGGGASGNKGNTSSQTSSTEKAVETKPKEEKPAKWDVEAAYAKLATGMTKAQAEEATGKPSDNCSETDMGQYGTSETCSYGNAFVDKASIIVTFRNGELDTKTKSVY